MPQAVIAEEIRLALVQSLPIVERHRERLIARMQEQLVVQEESDEPFGQGDVTAIVLTRLLIDGAADIVSFGGVRDLAGEADSHRELEIDGRHYSRFGLALGRVMGEAFGPRLSPTLVAAWVDAYWWIIRELTPELPVAPRA